ncbi:hypothetical protein FLONG3_4493 [Fusarium longipes]|uniref:Uncharacterized protein n=1 Tax=Fusarium longipes TaxID=694270 RepID=A0A395SZE8_9HYPO|nr:hypothetical protein FLONG3_4493 [Fusarium longipes]
MNSWTKVVDGKVVTDTDVEPPTGWTVDYDYFGGDNEWGEDGEVSDLVAPFGIEGSIKPLFRSSPRGNEVIFVYEINEQYYIHDAQSGQVQRIVSPTSLEEIVEFINEQGWFRLETESL